MRDFRELNWSDGTEAVMALLPRLTVMRGILSTRPMTELIRLCGAVIDGNIRAAYDAVYSMTSALMTGNYRRVTGELFKDFLLHELFLSEHPFALMAASNRIDEALYNSMKDDLDILCSLRELDGETLVRFVQERYRELRLKIQPQRDLAARRAEAAWGGGVVRPADEDIKPLPKLPLFLPSGFPSWHYGEEEMRDSFVSDEALEEMYHRFLEADPGWSQLNEDLWNFFAAYGSGEFLRVRHFIWTDGRLVPVEETRVPSDGTPEGGEYRACLERFIAFMRGESAETLVIGDGGAEAVYCAADELPELRVVCVPGKTGAEKLIPLFGILRDQPLKFAVLPDKGAEPELPERLVPANVMIVKTSDNW